MREILFRGLETYFGNEWIVGRLIADDVIVPSGQPFELDDYCLLAGELEAYQVKPETVGQFTGLTDKNGVKIFEGDIVEYVTGGKTRLGRVFFSDFRSSFSVTAAKNGSARINNDLYHYIQNGNSVTVIGNIHDNPEVFGGDDNAQEM